MQGPGVPDYVVTGVDDEGTDVVGILQEVHSVLLGM